VKVGSVSRSFLVTRVRPYVMRGRFAQGAERGRQQVGREHRGQRHHQQQCQADLQRGRQLRCFDTA
jgi:hypothetical protein